MTELKVQLLHTSDCHIWKTSLEELEAALKEVKKEIRYEVVQITNQQEADEYTFTGSPTILLNGVNVDPLRRSLKKFIFSGCTPYFWKGKSYEYPPKEMIVAALK